jgi:hypothetical protein
MASNHFHPDAIPGRREGNEDHPPIGPTADAVPPGGKLVDDELDLRFGASLRSALSTGTPVPPCYGETPALCSGAGKF